MALERDDGGEDEFRESDRGGEGAVVLGEEVHKLVREAIGVDAGLEVRGRAAEVVLPVKRLERRWLGALGEVGGVEDLEEGRGEGDVGARALDDAEEGAEEVETERVVARGRNQSACSSKSEWVRTCKVNMYVPDRTERDLDERVEELVKRTLPELGHAILVARFREHERPEVDRMDELPVVDGFERVLGERSG